MGHRWFGSGPTCCFLVACAAPGRSVILSFEPRQRMTPDCELFQSKIAQLVLNVAKDHGFVLGGSRALIAYVIVSRPTEDVDIFADADDGVQASAELVRTARCWTLV